MPNFQSCAGSSVLRRAVKDEAQYLVFGEVTAIVRERDLFGRNTDANRHRPRLIRKIARVLDQLPQPSRREFRSVLFEVRESLHDLLRVIAMKDSTGLGV